MSTAATSAVEEGEVEEARGLRGGELAPRSSPPPSPKVFLSLKDASLPTETRRRCRVPERKTGDHRRTAIYRGHPGDGVQASMPGTGDASEVMPQAALPVRAFQHLGERSREPLQDGNADWRIPGITFLPEVRLSSRVPLATIRAQMAMGSAQQRQAQQPSSSQQGGAGIPAPRRTESGAAPGRQRGFADPRDNFPAGGTTIKQGPPGDNPRADGNGQCAAAAGATSVLITAGGASGGGSARVERRSKE